ncbi:MAG TPA: S1 RNA-binding domain-containing protein [Elusimicrobiales bacterium]|nr:S1 RNA-binding domain-containing protein [Elusimicrobiales bacterium]
MSAPKQVKTLDENQTQTQEYAGDNMPKDSEQQPETEEITMDKLLAEQDNLSNKLYDREIVRVKVIQTTDDGILVDIGEKKEGLIPKTEFEDRKNIPEAGQKIPAILIRKGSEKFHAILSYKKALEKRGLDLCRNARESKIRVKGIIRKIVRGGYLVEVFGIRGFMPLSLSELHPSQNHCLPEGAKTNGQIVEISTGKQRMIFSRKSVLEENEKERRGKVLKDIKAGDILRVVVSKVVKDKLFLRYQGIEAVVKLENVSWLEPEKVIFHFGRGQRLSAKLLILDKEQCRLEFGLKQLYPNPADILIRKYPIKSVVKGKITKITDKGMLIAVSSRTNGFIPSSDFGQELEHKEGENISGVVTGINTKDYSLKLSVKRFEVMQNRRVVAKYLKKPKPLTLGQLLSKEMENRKGD